MLRALSNLFSSGQLTEIERLVLPEVLERREFVPTEFGNGLTGNWLKTASEFRSGIWRHQAIALSHAKEGKNVVVATGTASGKSLIFQTMAFWWLGHDQEATVIVFYPLKALVADQLQSWKRIASLCGISSDVIARVDGDVDQDERRKILDRARIVLATPDVVHAWLMGKLAQPSHKRFLSRLRLAVIDEAHVLESVFGSNFAFFFRRLLAASKLAQRSDEPKEMQVIAASATISNANEHMQALTGLKFLTVDERDDGSPRHRREIIHLASPPGDEIKIAESIQRTIVAESTNGSFITFVDSRQGVERLAVRTNLGAVVRPYRSGYEASDRTAIEEALRSGILRGVVSTSALELGIDIPHFSVGLNLGVPSSRKSFRQRMGRVGRTQEGCFAIIAEHHAFRKFGTTLREYFDGSIEPSYLYLHNRFIQYTHARCLAEELEMLGVTGRKAPPGFVDWPEGFKEIFDYAYVGGPSVRPRAFDSIHRIGGDQPHIGYPLRAVAEEAFSVRTGGGANGPTRPVGNLTLQQAIREAYPGALYLHLAKGWKVQEWRSTSFERTIRVTPSSSFGFTRPLLRTFVNISIEREGIVDGRFRFASKGFLAECQLQITERVEGYEERGEKKLYQELRQANPSMTPKTRDFRTTGVVIHIPELWFSTNKRLIAEALHGLLLREFSISAADVDFAATNISLVRDGQRQSATDVMVIYDATYGSLRLSEPMYTKLDLLMERLRKAVDLLPDGIVSEFERWCATLGSDSVEDFLEVMGAHGAHADGWIQIYTPGSIVAKRDQQNIMRDMEVLGPELVSIDGPPKLFYRYRVNGGSALISADSVEPVGDSWGVTYWNPVTKEYKDALNELIIPPERAVLLSDSVTETEA